MHDTVTSHNKCGENAATAKIDHITLFKFQFTRLTLCIWDHSSKSCQHNRHKSVTDVSSGIVDVFLVNV